jgi:[FeFe] hydrogenase (group B1/B3)
MPDLNIFEKLRGIPSAVTNFRRRVFSEVALHFFSGAPIEEFETIPFKIITPDQPLVRCCVFKERMILRERMRLSLGCDLAPSGPDSPLLPDVVRASTPQKILTMPIVQVITLGCERCPEHSYWVTNLCRGCIAHPCTHVCPKNAVSIVDGQALIDQEKCIRCGRCAAVCPYNAIALRERPCALACGVDAIYSDENGHAAIDASKCVSCGMCIVSCPFGAIAEKSEIVQVIHMLQGEQTVFAIVAPSFVSQFGPRASPEQIFEAIRRVGFSEVMEVAYGADFDVMLEVQELLELIEKKITLETAQEPPHKAFIGTSCCPSWVELVRKHFPDLSHNISESYTPMVETAKKVKGSVANAKVVFIGPCIAKKMETLDDHVVGIVDHVITFEELAGLFQAKGIDPGDIAPSECPQFEDASALGRGFPVAGGVVAALLGQARQLCGCPDNFDVPSVAADGLDACRKMLLQIQAKKISPAPLVVEGMACPLGCVGGPGTMAPLKRAARAVEQLQKKTTKQFPSDTMMQ